MYTRTLLIIPVLMICHVGHFVQVEFFKFFAKCVDFTCKTFFAKGAYFSEFFHMDKNQKKNFCGHPNQFELVHELVRTSSFGENANQWVALVKCYKFTGGPLRTLY